MLQSLLRTLALLGFLLFLARCAGIADAQEPPLRLYVSPWAVDATGGMRYSYTASIYSNAEASTTVTLTAQLDRRVEISPDRRLSGCVGSGNGPLVCTAPVYYDHPTTITWTVRVKDGVCGPPLTLSATALDTRGATLSAVAPNVTLTSRCRLYFPLLLRRR